MSLFVTSLNSGSNGNCYYIGTQNEAVIIDAGISCREIEIRMKRLGLDLQKVKAVFISHEHSDHISGLAVLSKKYQLPVYITSPTFLRSRLKLDAGLIKTFIDDAPVEIGNLVVKAFKKVHDAADPYSFMICCNKINVGVFTDIGIACKNVISNFKQCHAAFLESNYDEVMLKEGSYPPYLKNRISGGHGHLSNLQAMQLFKLHKPGFMSYLFLSHLSKNNNCPNLVQQLFEKHSGPVKIIIASRYRETAVYCIHNTSIQATVKHRHAASSQLSFTFG